MSDKEVKTYGEGTVYIPEGMYTEETLLDYLTMLDLMKERSKQLAEEMLDVS